jgi:hypothetical protein
MGRKLTPALVAQIQARRANGETLEALSKAFKLSLGTVYNAVRTRPTSRKAPPSPSPAPAPDDAHLPTPEDLRRDLASQVRALQAEIGSAETPELRAKLNRILIGAQQLLARVTPPDPNVAPAGMVLVPAAEMRELAQKGEDRLLKLLEGTLEGSKSWPVCPACRQKVAPPESR